MLIYLIVSSIFTLTCAELQIGQDPLEHPCNRKCSPENSRKTCYFKFEIETKTTGMVGCTNCIKTDGHTTIATVINNQLPGPPITVCQNDTIVVNVTNKLLEPTTIHWHGILQTNTPWMDGTQYLTQFPIRSSETIQYRFEAENSGTFFYHSHFAEHRALGAYGSLIVRSETDSANTLYDEDSSVIFLSDWFYDKDIYKTRNILINGLGQSHEGEQKSIFPEYKVKKGLRYRFRAIYSSNTNCALEISVDNHNLTVISSDRSLIEPITVESIGITSGERYDFIINADQEVGTYWIRAKGNSDCGSMIQGAVLRYEGSFDLFNVSSLNSFYTLNETQINPITNDRNTKDISINQVRSFEPWNPVSIYPTYYMNVTLSDVGFMINQIYYQSETRLSLLQNKDMVTFSEYYCNSSQFEKQGIDCTQTLCKCAHMIDIPCREYVEIFFFNPTTDAHPMHFHGLDLRVVGYGKLPPSIQNTDQIKKMDEVTPFPRNYDHPPKKDNIQVQPLGGYVILQMFTSNPGFWAVHCHVGAHSKHGMFAIFKVCDAKDMKTVPEFAYCPK